MPSAQPALRASRTSRQFRIAMHAAQSTRILGRAFATQAHIRTRVQPDRSLQIQLPRRAAGRRHHAVHPPSKPRARGPEARTIPEVGALAISPFITAIPGAHGSKVSPSGPLGVAAPEPGFFRRRARGLCGAPLAGSGVAHPYPDSVSQCPSPVPSSAPVQPQGLRQEDSRLVSHTARSEPGPSHGKELLSADRKLWAAISDLLGQQWSLDDALYELTHMRNDVHSLLQLRPKISKPSVPAPPRPATPRQRAPKRDLKPTRMPSRPAKKGKGKSKGAAPSPKPKADWCTTYKGREVCRRYQTGSCTNDHCPFAHVCAIAGCQQKHPAMDHNKHT